MNKAMNLFIISLILCSTLFFSGCIAEQKEINVVTMLAGIDVYNVTSVSVRNELTGELTTINDNETIGQLFDVLGKLSLEKLDLESVSSRGYYSLKVFNESTDIASLAIIQEDLLEINGVFYKVYDTTIDIDELRVLIDPVDLSGLRISPENSSVSSLISFDPYEISRVSIVNGLSRESGSTDNRTMILKLISDLDAYQLEEPEEPILNGYRYFIYFYDYSGGVSRVSIVDNNSIQVGNVLYEVVGSSIDMAELDEFIDSSSSSTSSSDYEGLNVEISGVMESLSIEELNSRAEVIVTGTVTGVSSSRWKTPDGQRPDKPDSELNIGIEDMIYTDVGIHVDRYIKNSLDCQDLQITVEGGIVGEDSIWVEDSPSFEYGENVLLFLNWIPGREGMTVTGEYQGKFTMINDTAVRTDGEFAVIVEEEGDWVVTKL